jgi:hypothetical protein
MVEADLIVAIVENDHNGEPDGFVLQRMTNKGHDFLDASRDSLLWKKAMEVVVKPVGGAVLDVLLDWLKHEAKTKLGLPV